tara:strand:- start:43793 stop:44257 length:465 start_codon:yes stop_codon:yes gene_type:complete
MKKRISAHQLANGSLPDVQLTYKHALFVVEYLKDCAPRRAAEAAGFSPDYGQTLLEMPNIIAAIDYILAQRVDEAVVNADWVLWNMVDIHAIALQRGQLSAGMNALVNIGKHKQVDAFVAKEIKMEVSTNDELLQRLKRGRDRNSGKGDEVSFF